MHEKGAIGPKKDPIVEPPASVRMIKESKNMSNANGLGPSAIGTKSASFRQCKSFNLKESMLPKAPSSHENNRTLKLNGGAALSKGEAPLSVENGRKLPTSNGTTKSCDPPLAAAKPKQSPGQKADVHPSSRSEKVKSPDPQKKLPPIKTARVGGGSKTSASANKNIANLCAECKAELEGAVCFIGNDGRVSACTSQTAVRLCKNLKCANNNPEYVASLAAAITAPKKYLVSRRHPLNVPRSSLQSSKAVSDKTHTQFSNQNGSVSQHGESDGNDGDHACEEFDMQGELEDDVTSLEDIGELVDINGVASASPQRGRLNAYHRMRRRSFSVIERQGPEVVTLKKQMMQERKQAEEWMLDYAIEEALHKLAPASESKVKALVVAFESIIPHKDADPAVAAAAHDQAEGLKTPNKISVKI